MPSSISKLMKALTSTRWVQNETKEETVTQIAHSTEVFLLEWVCTGKKSHASTYTQRTLCTSDDRTTLRSNLHHRSPGSCSKCIQSSPTHTNGSCAKNTVCPCARCLSPGQPQLSLTHLFSHRSGFLWTVLCKHLHCNPRCHKVNCVKGYCCMR